MITAKHVALGRAKRAVRLAANALVGRDEAIRNAHAHGATIRAIAEVTELSAARVHQILHAEVKSK